MIIKRNACVLDAIYLAWFCVCLDMWCARKCQL